MLKMIPISAVLLLSVLSTYAQDNSNNITTTTPVTTPDSTTDSTDNSVPSPDTGTVTPTTTGTDSSLTPSNSITTTPVTTTPVITTPSPSTTTTPSSVTTTVPVTTTTPTTTAPANAFTCVGNTPSWNLNVSKDLITYSSSKDPSVRIKAVTSTTPVGDTTGNLQAFTAKDNNNRNVTILINRNASGCANGLPGQSYSYDAFVIFPNQVIVGCCNTR